MNCSNSAAEIKKPKQNLVNINLLNLQNLFTFWLFDKLSLWNRQNYRNYQNWICESKVFKVLQLALCRLKVLHWNIDIYLNIDLILIFEIHTAMNYEFWEFLTDCNLQEKITRTFRSFIQMTYLEYFSKNQTERTKKIWKNEKNLMKCLTPETTWQTR